MWFVASANSCWPGQPYLPFSTVRAVEPSTLAYGIAGRVFAFVVDLVDAQNRTIPNGSLSACSCGGACD